MNVESALTTRIAFVMELARRLHQYGTAAPRLEDAVNRVSRRLNLRCDIMSSPTSIIMSFADCALGEDALSQLTQVIRLSPGDIDLELLCRVDEIADRVIDGSLDIQQGHQQLRAIRRGQSRLSDLHTVLCYGIASAAVAAILHTSVADIGVSAATGMLIGALAQLAQRRPRLAASLEALSALLATMIATVVSFYLVPLSVKAVVLASVIVLLPGLTLTTAVRELSTQHLVSGVARLAGALAMLLKFAFGTLAATKLCLVLGLIPTGQPLPPVSGLVEWTALIAGCYAFAVLFKSARSDYLLVMFSAALGYGISYTGSIAFGAEFGVFIAGLSMGALSNLYAVIARRPGALVRVPGIILLVPGSVGFRSLSFMFERDIFLGIDTAFALMTLLVSLVAGLLFGDLLVAPRRSL